jgi:hypothetical protein
VTAAAGPRLPGPLLFVRYAYPPNALGYCGPADSAALHANGRADADADAGDPDLAALARSFDGAWPYLELIARRAGIADPLDRRVVEAYWVGNALLGAGAPGVAHHSFHVLCAYPWAAMLPDERRAGHALDVLDQCRIRWGRVTAVADGGVLVRSRPLVWDGRRLGLGRPAVAPARTSPVGVPDLAVGDRVSLHWGRVCDRLSGRQVRALRAYTMLHLDLVNRRLADRTVLSGPGGGTVDRTAPGRPARRPGPGDRAG